MASVITNSTSEVRLRMLADFRHHLRLFLHFSEEAAARFDLQPQQHQLLLQIAGAASEVLTTIGYAAERLGLRHNSVVELSKRCEDAGLVKRTPVEGDRRSILLEVTPKGREILEKLSVDHACELDELAPRLIETLSAISSSVRRSRTAPRRIS